MVYLTKEQWEDKINEADAAGMRSLMEAALLIGDKELQHAVVVSILDKWLMVDANGFIKFWNMLQVDGAGASMAVVALAMQDSLTRLTEDQAASDEILLVVQRLIDYLAENDPEKALEWAKRYLLDDTKEAALVAIARGLARKNVGESLKIANAMESPLRRSQAYAAIGMIWAEQDSESALRWAISLTNPAERALAINSVLLVASGENLSSAAMDLKEQAKLLTEQYLRERNAELAARGLTEADLANDPATYRDMLESGAISAPYSPDVELFADSAKVIGSKMAAANPSNAVDWAESLEGDYLKMKSLEGVLDGWARNDPKAAIAYLSQNYPNNTDLLNAVYLSWAAVNPQAAANSAASLGNSTQSALALESVIQVWTTKGDMTAAANYVSQLPSSLNTDGVKYALATAISYNQPEKAWKIAQTITGESEQYRALKSAFSVMVTQDPSKASQILNGTTLPSQTSEKLGEMVSAVVGN